MRNAAGLDRDQIEVEDNKGQDEQQVLYMPDEMPIGFDDDEVTVIKGFDKCEECNKFLE